jgi:hypothetical protein
MREQEMRSRVFGFLKARMRNMIMPVAVGIGLVAGGCAKTEDTGAQPSDAAKVKCDVNHDDVLAVGPEVPPSETREAPMASDVAVDQSVADQAPATDATDSGFAVAAMDVFAPMDGNTPIDQRLPETGSKYGVPNPMDSGNDRGGEAGPIIAKYLAPTPDAAIDLGLVVRYMAPMLDSGA